MIMDAIEEYNLCIKILRLLKIKRKLDPQDYAKISGSEGTGRSVLEKLAKLGFCTYRGYGTYVSNKGTEEALESGYFETLVDKALKEEEDRFLDNESKRKSMKYAKRSYIQSWVAIIISAIATLISILCKL